MASHSMHHEKHAVTRSSSEQHKAAFDEPVGRIDRVHVIERGRRFLEAYAVLSRIGRSLCGIPFEVAEPNGGHSVDVT